MACYGKSGQDVLKSLAVNYKAAPTEDTYTRDLTLCGAWLALDVCVIHRKDLTRTEPLGIWFVVHGLYSPRHTRTCINAVTNQC